MTLTFVGVLLVCFGKLTVNLCSFLFAEVHVTVLGLFPPHPLLLLLVLLLSLFLWTLNSQFSVMGGWGWVWLAGLVAGLQVGQAFGVFLLPGLGVGGSSL